MHFKIDENLRLIADAKNETPEAVSIILCNYLIGAGILEDDWRNYGKPFNQVAGSILVENIAKALSIFLYNAYTAIPAKVFSAFCELKIMGDGNCPDCGGDLELEETEGHRTIWGDGIVTPRYDYEITAYVYSCDCCGKTFKYENEI